MAIMAERRVTRARQALKQLGGSRAAAKPICLACGKPIGAHRSVGLHGETFHESCALYRSRSRAAS
jgi:hypothetical protein